MAKREGAILALALVAFALWPRRANASTLPSIDVTIPDAADPWFDWGFDFDLWGDTPAPDVSIPDWDILPPVFDVNIDATEKLRAFLYMIRCAETNVQLANSGNAYFTFYGFKTFRNLSDHPVITGEMQPARLPDGFCAPAGLRAPCYTTAAGAYQFTRPTWERVRKAGAWGPYLPDFTKSSQDEAARRLIVEAGAWPALVRDDIAGAIGRIAHLWASLPGSTAEQGGIDLATAAALYQDGYYWG